MLEIASFKVLVLVLSLKSRNSLLLMSCFRVTWTLRLKEEVTREIANKDRAADGGFWVRDGFGGLWAAERPEEHCSPVESCRAYHHTVRRIIQIETCTCTKQHTWLVHNYIHMYIYIYACICIHTDLQLYVYIKIYVQIYIDIHIYV